MKKNKCSFALLKYDYDQQKFFKIVKNYREVNVGDYIQSFAAKNLIEKYFGKNSISKYIHRDNLANYKGELINIILNGWYSHNKKGFNDISDNINPLLISIHISNSKILTNNAIQWFKKFDSIGCRDKETLHLLKNLGVKNAYFSSCLTTTFDSSDFEKWNKNKILVCLDNIFSIYGLLGKKYNSKKLETNKMLIEINKIISNYTDSKTHLTEENTLFVTQRQRYSTNHNNRFLEAKKRLNQINGSKLVITSRIHIALPSLALGTPVIFINKNHNDSRYNGIQQLFNQIDITDSNNWKVLIKTKNIYKNPDNYKKTREELIDTVKNWECK